MASTFFTLLVGAVLLFILYFIKKYTYWKRRGIPTAKGVVPFVGNILPVLTFQSNFNDMHNKMYKNYKQYSMVGYYKLWTPVLIVREPQMVKTILQSNFSSFHKNALTVREDLDPLLVKNPFFTYGESWSRSRKRMTYAFSNVRLKSLFVTVNGVCKKFEDFLNRRLAFDDKYETELKHLFSKFTGEVVANAGLGIEGFCFEDTKHAGAFDIISEPLFEPGFFRAFENNALFITELRNLLRSRWIPKEFDALFRNIVKENIEIRQKESTPRNDFLQLMFDLMKTSNENIDLESITAEALSFYVDGFETSSITLSFIGYNLAAHPDVQEKLRQEITSKIAKYDGVLTFDALKEMTYMEQVMSESQRLYPALSALSKTCTEKFELQGSDGLTLQVEPGTEIIIPHHGLQVDPQYWVDPEVFDPERFNEEKKQSIVKMTFLPFGEGPRMCVGMKMAMLQMKACLATLVGKYKLTLSPKIQLPLKMTPYHFLAAAQGGLWVHISKI